MFDLETMESGATVEQTYANLKRWMKSNGAPTVMLTREGNTKCVAMCMKPLCAIEWVVANTLEETKSIINKLRSMLELEQKNPTNVTYPNGNNSRIVCALSGCDEQHNLKQCSKCKSANYCSKEHQKKHWKVHKKACVL